MIKGFRQIASLTAVSRVFGFVRDIAYSHFFGANALLDAWTIAFKIPNLARRLFGEGAASASFIPVYSEELHKDRHQAKQLVNTVVTVLFVLLAAIVLLGQGLIWTYYKFFSSTTETRLILSLTSIMLPYMLLVCIVAILAGILNVHRHFAAPAAAPIVLNIFIITSVVLTGWALKLQPRQQLFCVAVAVLIAGLTQIAIQIPPLRASGVSIRPNWGIHSEAFRKIIILMGPMILGLTVTQLNTLADDLIAWWFSASPEKGTVFILLGKTIAYPLTVSQGLCSCLFIAIPATVGLVAIARPLISLAFQHGRFSASDTNMVTWTLLFYTLGLSGYFAQQLVTRAFYSMQDSFTPMTSALIAVVTNIVLNLVFIWFLGTGGLAASTAVCSYLQVVILILALRARLGPFLLDGLATAFLKTITATLCMSIAIAAILWLTKNYADILKLLLVVPVAAAVYLLAAKFLHIKTLSLLTSRGRAMKETMDNG